MGYNYCQPMPAMNGIDVASDIKKSWKDTVIIGLSGKIDAYTTDAFMKAGPSSVTSKHTFDHLYSEIQRACNNTIIDHASRLGASPSFEVTLSGLPSRFHMV